MLSRVSELIDSRCSAETSSGTVISHKLLSLGKTLQNERSAVEYTDSIMAQLLGTDSVQAVSYRGNRTLTEVSQLKQALGLLLREEGLENDADAVVGQYEIQMGQLSSHMQLDRIAAESIHLLPPPRNASNAKCGSAADMSRNSIYGILNQCKTKMGSRLLETWLRQPLIDKQEIEARHDVVEWLVQQSVGRDQLRDSALGCVGDLDVLASKMSAYVGENGGSGSGSSGGGLETLYRMYLFADQQLPLVVDAFQEVLAGDDSNGSKLCEFLKELKDLQAALTKVKGLAEAVLDFEFVPREFLVKSDFDEQLQDLKRELDEVETELEAIHIKMDQEWSDVSGQPSSQVRLETTDQDGCAWQFRLPKTNDERILREQFGNKVQVHRLLKNGVYFSTKELRNLGTEKQNVLTEYHKRQKSIVNNAMNVAATFVPLLEKASQVLGELDVLASFAHVAAYNCAGGGYCRPVMTDGNEDGMGITVSSPDVLPGRLV